MARNKTIITCAVTGAIHSPTMSDALPYTYEDIATDAIAAAKAGAAIIHLHARNPETGAPSADPEDFRHFLGRIREETDSVVNISTGGAFAWTIQKRIKPALTFEPEMCSMNMGSMNFSIHPLAGRYEEWKFDWEEDYVRNSEGSIFRNSFLDIREAAESLEPLEIKFEHECYDVGHLYNLKFSVDSGLFKPPIFIQFVMGILGGISADIDNLVFMKQTADKLFGDGYRWSVLAAGAAQIPLATVGSQMGGNVRVGLEDSLFISRGKLADSSAQQVGKIRSIIEELGGEVATPDEAREILGLKGADRVNF